MNGAARTGTREIARAAVRAELARVAFGLFRQQGFDNVTLSDLAAAAGVSRSTFLRYFGSKEEAVLSAFDAQGDQVADTLRARPADEDDGPVGAGRCERSDQTQIDPVGKKTEDSLHKLGIRRIADLAKLDESFLVARFGQWVMALAGKARGEDSGIAKTEPGSREPRPG